MYWTQHRWLGLNSCLMQVENHQLSQTETQRPLCVFVGLHTHMRAHTHGLGRKMKINWGNGQVRGFRTHIWHHQRAPSIGLLLLTLPFALVAGEASGRGGVVSLGLRRRPFSWPLTPTREASLASVRFLARNVFHDRDFLYGTGTRNINQPIREKLSGVQLGLAAEATRLSGQDFGFCCICTYIRRSQHRPSSQLTFWLVYSGKNTSMRV